MDSNVKTAPTNILFLFWEVVRGGWGRTLSNIYVENKVMYHCTSVFSRKVINTEYQYDKNTVLVPHSLLFLKSEGGEGQPTKYLQFTRAIVCKPSPARFFFANCLNAFCILNVSLRSWITWWKLFYVALCSTLYNEFIRLK